MGKKVRSARGVEVDFDMIRIKQQIASGPAPMNVQNRQEFINSKLRRRVKKAPISSVPKDEDPVDDIIESSPSKDDDPKSDDSLPEEIVDSEEVKTDDDTSTDKKSKKPKRV